MPRRAAPPRDAIPRRRMSPAALRPRLEELARTFGPEHLSPDPLEVVRRFRRRDDVEVAGFIGAALAFGSARGAVRSAEALLERLGGAPGAAVRSWDMRRDAARLDGWRHRWLGPSDAAATLHVLGAILRGHGTVEAFFAAGDGADGDGPDGGAPRPIRPAIESFCARALALAPTPSPRFLPYWFAGPGRGGSAKRLCLWLRWMCRRDGLDPGPWTRVDPSRLVIPLDVHVARISRYVGLLRRRTADWCAAEEITARLREFDATDPVRFDYAICRLGILGTCPRRRDRRKCEACPLFEVCLL